MTTLMTVPEFPLYSIVITDWLPKIGEKAFLAWMNLHTWKDHSQVSESAILPLPINQVIKQLKVGNSTFYNQILRPLWNYGLIELEKIPGTNQFHIKVHFYPQNQLEKANQPLIQIRDYDQDWSSCPPPKVETVSDNHNMMVESHQIESDDAQSSPRQLQMPPQESVEKRVNSNSLPSLISEALHTDPLLLSCKADLENVYLRCNQHPKYSDLAFLQKIQECLPYYPHIEKFAAYLYKAIINEWNQPVSTKAKPSPPSSPIPIPPPSCPRDVPTWVWKQDRDPPEPAGQLSPEQQAIAAQLLQEISQLGR